MANMQNSKGANREIPVKAVREFTLGNDELRYQRIAKKAYELYQCRGCCHGHDLDDWLEAERLILSDVAAPKTDNAQEPRHRGPRTIKR